MLYRTCENCGNHEERVFVDSWTGKELCIICLASIINAVTMSPASGGDNLEQQLKDDGKTTD